MATEDDEYIIPLQDQRVFGAGIKRKGITFVPAAPLDTTLPTSTKPNSTAADRYLSIVLPKSDNQQQPETPSNPPTDQTLPTSPPSCPICTQLITPTTTTTSSSSSSTTPSTHESSIAHQLCLTHSHLPSHLPRTHIGVKYLTSHGWDPDSRTGLGLHQDGIRIPIKAHEKRDTVGLREVEDDDDDVASAVKKSKKSKRRFAVTREDKTTVRLNAKEVRKRDVEAKKRAEMLRENFYGSGDVARYLGS